jgi:hypothetical protein
MLRAERSLLGARCAMSSSVVNFFTTIQVGCMKVCLTFISEDCIVKTLESTQETTRLLKLEIECRCDNDGIPNVQESDFNGDDVPR